MSKYATSGLALAYRIDFEVDGELVVPASASITLTKNDNTVAGGIENEPITLDESSTSAAYVIPSGANIKTLDYEIRYVTVTFVYEGVQYQINDMYALMDNVAVPVSKNDVRTLLSMTKDELPDDKIDLVFAYHQLQEEVTDVDVVELVTTGSALLPYVSRAIAAKAAINACSFLELMIYQSEQADNTLYRRFESMDFEGLQARLRDVYYSAISKFGEATEAIPALFIVVTGTDPVTGA